MGISFLQGDIVHKISRNYPNKWIQLNELLNKYQITIIGPNHIRKYKHLKYKNYIEIPYINCYLEKDYIINEVNKIIDSCNKTQVFIFCAGMASSVFIDLLVDKCINKHYLLDMGSSLDLFINDNRIKRRTPVKGYKRDKILLKYPKDYMC